MANNKEKVEEKKEQLIQLTTEFSQQYLNEEYNAVIEKLISKMARKRDVPFVTGKIEIWAAAVIHALGTVNFLFDKASQPYVSVTDICQFFDTKQSTTTQKSKMLRDMFNMSYFDDNFSTDTVDQSNPFNNLTIANGLLVPQDMLKEQSLERDVLEEWELKVAHILGVSKLAKEKKYNDNDLSDLLEVTYERLLIFYDYLHHHLTFPFPASYEQEVGPLKVAEYDVNCIRLDQEMKVDEFYGILVECRQGRKKVIIPLADIDVIEEGTNCALIEMYHSWFWTYR
jgi:hypothetical protein